MVHACHESSSAGRTLGSHVRLEQRHSLSVEGVEVGGEVAGVVPRDLVPAQVIRQHHYDVSPGTGH